MKQSLGLRQGQKLSMSPQLQQAIRLLQMSTTELSEEMQLAHEFNPLLEFADQDSSQTDTFPDPDFDKASEIQDSGRSEADSQILFNDTESTSTRNQTATVNRIEIDRLLTEGQFNWDDLQSYLPVDQRRSRSSHSLDFDETNAPFVVPEDPNTLRESLGNQAIALFSDENERRIAHHIIQNINDAGYIDVPLQEIQQTLSQNKVVTMDEIENVLWTIQQLEPAGVAARNPKECLMLQIQSKSPKLPGFKTACRIVRDHLEQLAKKDYQGLRKALCVSEQALGHAVDLIQQLNPHPGYSVGKAVVNYVIPDIMVEKKEGHWDARLNPNALPKLCINHEYQKLVNQSSGEFSRMKEQLQHARWLLNNIEKRHQTILSVAQEIVEYQQNFFHHGANKMRPLTLRDIADSLEIHESTVSRATSGKFLSAPQGIYELKHFFSSQIQSKQGDAISSVAIQSAIRNVIENELSTKPISDEKICVLLSDMGFKVARRTVTKYRDQMNIPSSSKRKSL